MDFSRVTVSGVTMAKMNQKRYLKTYGKPPLEVHVEHTTYTERGFARLASHDPDLLHRVAALLGIPRGFFHDQLGVYMISGNKWKAARRAGCVIAA